MIVSSELWGIVAGDVERGEMVQVVLGWSVAPGLLLHQSQGGLSHPGLVIALVNVGQSVHYHFRGHSSLCSVSENIRHQVITFIQYSVVQRQTIHGGLDISVLYDISLQIQIQSFSGRRSHRFPPRLCRQNSLEF